MNGIPRSLTSSSVEEISPRFIYRYDGVIVTKSHCCWKFYIHIGITCTASNQHTRTVLTICEIFTAALRLRCLKELLVTPEAVLNGLDRDSGCP